MTAWASFWNTPLMSTPQEAEYGFWKSPITSDLIVADSIGLGCPARSNNHTYWSEGRPAEGGRYVIVRRAPDGTVEDVNPAPYNARTRVHEYGGGEYLVHESIVYFSNYDDQRLYRREPGGVPQAITPEVAWRYADGVADPLRPRLIIVREDHTSAGREAVNTIVGVDRTGPSEQQVLVSGSDFYSNPRINADGSRLTWMSWDHPNMPWNRVQLWTAEIGADGSLGEHRLVAGDCRESIFQPEWSPDGVLYFVSDRNGWWNLYRQRDGEVEPVVEMEAEFGVAQWAFGESTYAFASARKLICTYLRKGASCLASIDLESRELEPIDVAFTAISGLSAGDGHAYFRGGTPTRPNAIVDLDLATGKHETYRVSFEVDDEIPRYFSVPEAIEFPTEGSRTAHAFFYPPHNPDHTAPEGELPPLIVKGHGGPTGFTSNVLSLFIQYWTSRGFGVLDVNYGGSSGYGREYRERLEGQWGVVDLDDCSNGAKYLVEQGRADGDRLIIKGGSAGGYTTLAALAFRDVFRAGASYYGVSDLEALAKETHKFESRYMDSMIGPYPERRDLYVERSPLHHADKISAPVIFFQGAEDKVVPPNQAEKLVAALRAKGLPVSYILFDGEQHGFRRAENIKRALDAELYFYAATLLRKGLRF